LSNTVVSCRQCGYPTTGTLGDPSLCPLCTADGLKGGPMVCKKCHKACQPIGATLRGVQLVACPSCGQVYTPDLMKLPAGMPAMSITQVGKKPAKITSKKSVTVTSRRTQKETIKQKVKTLTKRSIKNNKSKSKSKR